MVTQPGKSSITIRDVHIHDLQLGTIQWAGVQGIADPFGGKLDFKLVTLSDGTFNGGNALFNAQLALLVATEGQSSPSFSGPYARDTSSVAAILAWTRAGSSIMEESWFVPQCTVDAMNHANKGAFGMRLEFTDSVDVRDVTVARITAQWLHSRSPDWCSRGQLDTFGLSLGKNGRVKMQRVQLGQVGTVGVLVFDTGGLCRLQQVTVCNATTPLVSVDSVCNPGGVVESPSDHCG